MTRAVYMPETYNPSQGEVEVVNVSDILSLLGIVEGDLSMLPLPNGEHFYMSRAAQRAKGPPNQTATFVLERKLPLGICIRGPALWMPGPLQPSTM